MNKTEIQLIGRNEEQLQAILTLINSTEHLNGTIAAGDEEAIEQFQRFEFSLVVIGEGMKEEEVKKLRKIFTIQQEDIIILEHNGTDYGKLMESINEALKKQMEDNKPKITMLDDALKNAGLKIIIQ